MRGVRGQDASLEGTGHGSTSSAQASPRRTPPARVEESDAEQVVSPQPSVVHVGSASSASRIRAAQEPSLVHLQEALTNPGVSASCDDALDLRVDGQVSHGVLKRVC